MVEFCMFISSYDYSIRICYWRARGRSMVDVAVKRCDSFDSSYSLCKYNVVVGVDKLLD